MRADKTFTAHPSWPRSLSKALRRPTCCCYLWQVPVGSPLAKNACLSGSDTSDFGLSMIGRCQLAQDSDSKCTETARDPCAAANTLPQLPVPNT